MSTGRNAGRSKRRISPENPVMWSGILPSIVRWNQASLSQTVEYAGDHHFMYASDFPHWDTEFPENIEALWNHSGLSTNTKEKILYHNAKTFFGLN
jgi:predicted TIM-barrel fold metal-dependent hydrolase